MGLASLCRLKHCFSLHKDTTPPQSNHTVTPTHIEPEQYSTWNKSTISLKLLKMDVLTFETCWAVNGEILKRVISGWSIFIQLFFRCCATGNSCLSICLSVCLKGIYNQFVQIFLNWTGSHKVTRALVSLEMTLRQSFAEWIYRKCRVKILARRNVWLITGYYTTMTAQLKCVKE